MRFEFIRLMIVVCLFSRSVRVNGAKILALFPFDLKSHYIIYDSLLSELAIRGHSLTVVNSYPKTRPLANFEDVDVSDCVTYCPGHFDLDIAHQFIDPFVVAKILIQCSTDTLQMALTCPQIRQLYRKNTTYDLILTEIFGGDEMLTFVDKFKAPVVSFCGGAIYPWVADRIGNPFNPAYMSYPHTNIPLMPNPAPSFWHRLYNTIVNVYASTLYYYGSRYKSDETVRKYGDVDHRSLQEIAKNTSLILTFSHFSITNSIPLLPNLVEVAGLHIKKAKPLPEHIQKFIDESEHGVIYFSLGSLLKIETMPENKLKALVTAFSQLRQRVIWKWNTDTLPGKSDNILIGKWFPQRDILAHPNVKLFISHCGALSINEAVYEGVPVLGIPMFGDQSFYVYALKSSGAGEVLLYEEIYYDNVISKLQLMLENDEYSKNMRKLSQIFRDRPMSAMDTAVYWIEYVIRHKGAYHLRSAAVDLPLYQYFLLDVILFLIVIVFSIFFVVYWCSKKLIQFTCGKKTNKNVDSKKHR